MDSLYIVMPAYNEEKNIKAVIKQWYPILDGKSEKSRLVVADSGSKDKTHLILENLKKTYPKIEIISDTGQFHGPKVIALYDHAIKNGADYIFQTDSDGQTLPSSDVSGLNDTDFRAYSETGSTEATAETEPSSKKWSADCSSFILI